MLFLVLPNGIVLFTLFTYKFLLVHGSKKSDGYSYRFDVHNIKREARWKVVFFEECGKPYCEKSSLDWEDGSLELEVLKNERVTHKDHFQDVRLISVRGSDSQPYSPGDYALVRARNSREDVDGLLSLLHTHLADVSFTLTANDVAFPVPPPMRRIVTLRHCATLYWDLTALPKRHAVELLLEFAMLKSERERLQHLSVLVNFDNHCIKTQMTVLELLTQFPNATASLPLSHLFEVFHPIRLRAYSIASSPTVHHGEVHILVAVVEYNTSARRLHKGLCSHWLASRRVGDTLQVAIRTGSFRFPENSSVPLMMVGPGTGVAPFRSLVQERARAGVARHNRLLLAFGCRRRSADFYLRNEWDSLKQDGRLTLLTAFSRDQPEKVYVQDVLRREADLAFDWLRRGGRVFVCGRADGMPGGVRRALVDIIQTAGNRTADSAERFIARLEEVGFYQTVVWS